MTAIYDFHLSGGLTKTDEVIRIARRLKAFGKPVRVVAYDTVQGLQWNGGRLIFNKEFAQDPRLPRYADITIDNPEAALERVARLNDEGIAFNLTFNSTLETIDADEEVGNFLLERLHNELNSVTVATERLRRHIRAHYPKYTIIASICMALSTIEECIQACERYDKVVMLPVFAYEPERFACLPKDKLIFLINDLCYLFCVRKDHYDYISRCSLAGNTSREEQRNNLSNLKCFVQSVPGYRAKVRVEGDRAVNARVSALREAHLAKEGREEDHSDFNFNITETARRGLIQAGITQFKLQGREMSDEAYQRKVVDFLEMVVRDEL